MSSPLARGGDDVRLFLREVRRVTRENKERLEHIATHHDIATKRLAGILMRPPTAALIDLVDEMTVRDEELKATTDELVEQIDSLRRASALLERERGKYVDLFEQAPDAYVVTNLAGVVDEANRAAGMLFRGEPDLLVGRPLISFVARQDTRSFRWLLRELQASDSASSTPRQATLRMRPRGQPVFVVFVRVGAVIGDRGRPVALRWVLRQFDLDEAQTGKGAAVAELASALAEDLRGPMAAIAAGAAFLREQIASRDEDARQALDWIDMGARAQQGKIEDLTEFASAYGGGVEAEVTDVADAVARLVRAEGGDWSRLILESHAKPGETRVAGAHLPRALEIFLLRALEGTPRLAGPMPVRIRAHGHKAFLEIDAAESARIPAGWGVRTGTAVRIVERCGGRVLLRDPSPSVRLSLPRLPV
jgi:PAS domain-containing protein